MASEYLDDIVFYDQWRQWNSLVAILALRLDWVYYRSMLHLQHWPDWRNISHLFSRCLSSFIRHMGLALACF